LNDNCVLCADHLCFQHTHTHTHAHTCMHTHIHTRTHTHTQTQTLAKIHAITHTNICTQMHVAAHFLVPLLLVCPRIPTTGSHTKALHINMPGVLWAHVTSVECHWPSHPLFFVLVGKWAPLELGTQGRLLHTRYCKAWLI